jgi:hypothetical protein
MPRAALGKTKLDCSFSADRQSRKHIEKGEVIAWFKVPSDDYLAEENVTTKEGFNSSMHIRSGDFPLFRMDYTRNMTSIRIQIDGRADLFKLMDPESTRLYTGGGGFHPMRCDFFINGPAKRAEFHPLNVLERSFRYLERSFRVSRALQGHMPT